MIALPKRLLYLRELNDLSQAAVARKLHMSPTGYFEYESGRSNPPLETLIKIADFYKVTTDFLIGYTPEDKELSKLFQDIRNVSPDGQQKVIEWVRLLKVDAAYQAEQQRRADRKQQRLAGSVGAKDKKRDTSPSNE